MKGRKFVKVDLDGAGEDMPTITSVKYGEKELSTPVSSLNALFKTKNEIDRSILT